MTDLSLVGTSGESALVNDRRESIGHSTQPGDFEDHALVWSDGEFHDLGTLSGSRSRPIGVTNDGDIGPQLPTTKCYMRFSGAIVSWAGASQSRMYTDSWRLDASGRGRHLPPSKSGCVMRPHPFS
jgi:probable HAF family extracellular repeat protein